MKIISLFQIILFFDVNHLDFNKASKMNVSETQVSGCSTIFSYLSKSSHGDRWRLDAKIDWGHFLCSICSYIGVDFKHINHKTIKGMLMSMDKIVGKYVKQDIVSEHFKCNFHCSRPLIFINNFLHLTERNGETTKTRWIEKGSC